jgi:hypothetical protein
MGQMPREPMAVSGAAPRPPSLGEVRRRDSRIAMDVTCFL